MSSDHLPTPRPDVDASRSGSLGERGVHLTHAAQATHHMPLPDDVVLRAEGLGKHYRLYDRPHHRLLQRMWPHGRPWYREHQALHGLDLELGRGQTLGVIGRNGAGKSTLLGLVCGTITPSAGRVRIRGRVAALLELGSGFNPEFTGRENLAVNAAILGLDAREIAERTDDILAFADIGDFIDQPVRTYSSGMFVRLAFSVVVHVSPEILVVDEALAVGDALFQARCMTRMRRMLDDGLTLLFTSHDITAVKALCQRTLWLERGRVRSLGPTNDVANDYALDWVRQANAQLAPPPSSPPSPSSSPSPSSQPAAAGIAPPSLPPLAADHPRSGTGAVRVQAAGLGLDGEPLQRRARIGHGRTLAVGVALRVGETCARLVVSFHLKDRQGQFVLGAHSRDRPEVFGRAWQPGEQPVITFRLPVWLHEGPYTLTLVVTTIGDTQRYTDAVFHDWLEDVAVLEVEPRAEFPLSDLVELDAEVALTLAPPTAPPITPPIAP